MFWKKIYRADKRIFEKALEIENYPKITTLVMLGNI